MSGLIALFTAPKEENFFRKDKNPATRNKDFYLSRPLPGVDRLDGGVLDINGAAVLPVELTIFFCRGGALQSNIKNSLNLSAANQTVLWSLFNFFES